MSRGLGDVYKRQIYNFNTCILDSINFIESTSFFDDIHII
ncbi:hypothetical protein JMUB7524_27210 [Staphylococcus aureus]